MQTVPNHIYMHDITSEFMFRYEMRMDFSVAFNYVTNVGKYSC